MNTLEKANKFLNKAANSLRDRIPVNDIALIQHYVLEAMDEMHHIGFGVKDDDVEFHGYLSELYDILEAAMCPNPVKRKKEILKCIGSMVWDNFQDDETGEPYSLGSMFYNKLQWIYGQCSNEEAAKVATALVTHLPKYFDALEKFANEK